MGFCYPDQSSCSLRDECRLHSFRASLCRRQPLENANCLVRHHPLYWLNVVLPGAPDGDMCCHPGLCLRGEALGRHTYPCRFVFNNVNIARAVDIQRVNSNMVLLSSWMRSFSGRNPPQHAPSGLSERVKEQFQLHTAQKRGKRDRTGCAEGPSSRVLDAA